MSCTQQVRLIRSSDNICKTCIGEQNLSYILFLIPPPREKKKAVTQVWKCIFKTCTYDSEDCSDICTSNPNLDSKGHLDLKL